MKTTKLKKSAIYLEVTDFDRYKKFRAGELEQTQPKGKVFFSHYFYLSTHSKRPNYWVFIRCKECNGIVGTLSYRHHNHHTKIRDIEILPEYRGNGYGTEVLKIIIRQARIHGSFLISLFVFNHRNVAQHIYRKLGFLLHEKFDNGKSMIKSDLQMRPYP